jgi:hypothetical protein
VATETEIAWAAGLFEGEGCVTWAVRPGLPSRLPSPHLIVVSTDHDVLVKFCQVVDCGTVARRRQWKAKAHWKKTWQWECRRWEDVLPLLGALLPYLGERRSDRAMTIIETCHQARERSCLYCGQVFMASMDKKVCCSDTCNSRYQKVRQRDPEWISTGPRGHGALL